jgi:DNA-binding MarR family transcriptional regulator
MRFVRAEAREDVLAEVAEELRLSGVTNDIADQVVADHLGLNRTDTRCLDIIERLDGVSAGRLAREAGLSTGAVTTVIDRLERAGLARRVRDPGDRRRVLVEVAPEAARGAPNFYGGHMALGERLYKRYTQEQLELLLEFVREGREFNEQAAAQLEERTRRSRAER